MKRLFAVLGVISILAISTIANALTGYCDPNGDVGTPQWAPTSGANYTNIDDGVRQPTDPDITNKVQAVQPSKVDIYDMTTLTGVGTVTNVIVWGHGWTANWPTTAIKVNILWNGSWTTATDFGLNQTGNYSWKSVSFDVTGTSANLDAMQIKITSQTGGGQLNLYALYAIVTYTTGGGGTPAVTGKVIMISDDGEGAPSSGYNYDYVSAYPPEQNDTYVKATSTYPPNNEPYYTTDPTKPLTGWGGTYTWVSDFNNITNQCFHIDLGIAKTVTRIYYENYHQGGTGFNIGVQNFTFYGSNTAGDFTDLVYADTGDWIQLTTSQATFDQHVAADQPDPKYITVTNTTAYRYYGFKFADNWGDDGHMGVRRIELQTTR